MNINASRSLMLSMLIALPFLGGVDECRGPTPEPEPEPEPELCLGDNECGSDAWCNSDRCLTPLTDSGEMAALTVCYGICEPRPVCEPVVCELYCEAGFTTDDRGCEVCSCAEPPPPPPVCEPVYCTLSCELGFETDERGCPICSCAEPPPPPECPAVLCDLFCESGFVTDERGCETCECSPPPPTDRHCGGFLGLPCAESEFCDYADDVPACGAADHLGTCRPRPEACYEIYAPVCGCDGLTYPNDCYAMAAGTDFWAAGECASAPSGR